MVQQVEELRPRLRAAREIENPIALRTYADGRQNELVLTSDGRYGYWRDETYADSETLVVAD